MRGRWLLGLAILAVSTGAPFARWANHGEPGAPIAIAALRVSFAAVFLGVVGAREWGKLASIERRDWRWIIAAGALLGLHFGSWIASLSFTSTAASVAIVATSPIFAALFGTLLDDRVSRREVGGIAIAAVGCTVLAGGDWQAGGSALVGDALSLIGAAAAAGYFVVGRRLRESVPLVPYLSIVNAIAAIGLVVAGLATGVRPAAVSGHMVLACGCAALVASTLGHSLLNRAVRTTPTHLVALAILGEPIGSSIITWIWFGEQPPWYAAAGGAVILIGIAVGFVKRR